MPTTISSSDITTFVSGTTLSSAAMNQNFANMRGHLIPLADDTSSSTDQTLDLGTADYRWRNIYGTIVPGSKETSGSYALTTTDSVLISTADTASTFTLPVASSCAGSTYLFLKQTLDFWPTSIYTGTTTGILIDGLTHTMAMHAIESAGLLSDGSNWQITTRRRNQWLNQSSFLTITANFLNTTTSTLPNATSIKAYRYGGEMQIINSFLNIGGTSGGIPFDLQMGLPYPNTTTANSGLVVSSKLSGKDDVVGFVTWHSQDLSTAAYGVVTYNTSGTYPLHIKWIDTSGSFSSLKIRNGTYEPLSMGAIGFFVNIKVPIEGWGL